MPEDAAPVDRADPRNAFFPDSGDGVVIVDPMNAQDLSDPQLLQHRKHPGGKASRNAASPKLRSGVLVDHEQLVGPQVNDFRDTRMDAARQAAV
jgi:hypothetical protein